MHYCSIVCHVVANNDRQARVVCRRKCRTKLTTSHMCDANSGAVSVANEMSTLEQTVRWDDLQGEGGEPVWKSPPRDRRAWDDRRIRCVERPRWRLLRVSILFPMV